MLGILAGTDLKYSCSGMCKAGFSGVSAPRAVLPEVYRKIGFWEMACIFLRPLVSGSHLFELLLEEYRVAYFREMTPGMVSVFSTSSWFNSGYVFGIRLRGFFRRILRIPT